MKVIQNEDRACLSLDGELTINNVDVLKGRLLEALGRSDRIELDLQGVTALDLAGLQILCSAHRTALEQGKVLSLASRQVPVLQQARSAAGFLLARSCRCNPSAADCFWVGGMPE